MNLKSIPKLRRFIAARSFLSWLSICIFATIFGLVTIDISAEIVAWQYLRAEGVPTWGILAGIAIGWARNSDFWSWIVLAGFCSLYVWKWAKKGVPDNSLAPEGPTQPRRRYSNFRLLWYGMLVGLPLLGATDASDQWVFVNGSWQQEPATFGNILGGFIAGAIIAAILLGVGSGSSWIFKKLYHK